MAKGNHNLMMSSMLNVGSRIETNECELSEYDVVGIKSGLI